MEVVKMKCPECKNGTVFGYVYTCNRHAVDLEGKIGDPIETADVDDSKMPDDYAECDNCGSVFFVDGDMLFLGVDGMPV
jgi:hypothetical protein